jgi:hypothetical protein
MCDRRQDTEDLSLLSTRDPMSGSTKGIHMNPLFCFIEEDFGFFFAGGWPVTSCRDKAELIRGTARGDGQIAVRHCCTRIYGEASSPQNLLVIYSPSSCRILDSIVPSRVRKFQRPSVQGTVTP